MTTLCYSIEATVASERVLQVCTFLLEFGFGLVEHSVIVDPKVLVEGIDTLASLPEESILLGLVGRDGV